VQLDEIKAKLTPVLQKHSVIKAGLFGSRAKGEGKKQSDLDILVEFSTQISLLQFVSIKLELQDAIDLKVDLVEYQAIKPGLRDSILQDEDRIYG
jgi:uncharacterized protein